MASEPVDRQGFVPVSYDDGTWRTADGSEVPWYQVQSDLLREAEVEGALERVLSVYGVSDVVVDAFDQFRKELKHPSPDEGSRQGGG
jgi:hypothetical protein